MPSLYLNITVTMTPKNIRISQLRWTLHSHAVQRLSIKKRN